MKLKYKRKISYPVVGDRATMVSIPKAIADAWYPLKDVCLVWNGESLVIRPLAEGA